MCPIFRETDTPEQVTSCYSCSGEHNITCCHLFEVIDFLAEQISQKTAINVMAQYRPCYEASSHPQINRRPNPQEIESVRHYALEKGLNVVDVHDAAARELVDMGAVFIRVYASVFGSRSLASEESDVTEEDETNGPMEI